MRIYDIIAKKRDSQELSEKEIEYFVNGYVNGEIEDYQISALLMAIYFNSMTKNEVSILTKYMAASGDTIDLSSISGIKVDKHSTGGVGDKTTLIVLPIVAACGVNVAKMSGRGLGYTGGTIDKLESIPGFRTSLSKSEFINAVKNVGISIVSQTGNLVPADKKLYALRDVTATVESIPLIASSIMSKKIAAGADRILLDVKTGSGAFIKDFEKCKELAETMVNIGESVGKETTALITNMDRPLGNMVGNFIEVIETVDVLKGGGPEDLRQICLCLASNMLYLSGKGDLSVCEEMVQESLGSGRAFKKFEEMVISQGGNVSWIYSPEDLLKNIKPYNVVSEKSGYIVNMDTEKCGIASMKLGAGREKKDDIIDNLAGIKFHKKTGDYVNKGENIATLYSSNRLKYMDSERSLLEALNIGDTKPEKQKLIKARITKKECKLF